jgi:hypothetical protein
MHLRRFLRLTSRSSCRRRGKCSGVKKFFVFPRNFDILLLIAGSKGRERKIFGPKGNV